MKVLSNLQIPSFAGNKPLISDGSDNVTEGGATATELSRLSGVTSNIQSQLDSKQGDIKKTVFNANFSTNPGWVKLGTLTGNSGGARFVFSITGKQGWNDQNFPGHAIIHGATNYISTDNGQLAAGAGWTESLGTGGVAADIALVRQSGYAATKFDLYIYINSAFVHWFVEVTTTGTWVTDIQSLQAYPGTGTNVFRPTRREIMLNTSFPDLLAIEALAGTSGFLKKTAANTWSLDTNSYLTTSGKAADSELLDGINSDKFVYGTNGATTNRSSGIFGDIAKSGFYDSNTASDSPTPNTWTHIIHGAHSFNPGAWGFQLAANFMASNSEGYFLRTKNNGTWQPWRTIWTSKDFTSTDIAHWETAYANNHNHDQSLNTSSSVIFSTIELTSNGAGNNIKVGDDVYLGDVNLAYTLGLKGVGDSSKGFIKFGSGYLFGYNGSNLVYNNNRILTTADGVITGSGSELQIPIFNGGSSIFSRNSFSINDVGGNVTGLNLGSDANPQTDFTMYGNFADVITMEVSGKPRWKVGGTISNFIIQAYDSAGNFIDDVISIPNASGETVVFNRNITAPYVGSNTVGCSTLTASTVNCSGVISGDLDCERVRYLSGSGADGVVVEVSGNGGASLPTGAATGTMLVYAGQLNIQTDTITIPSGEALWYRAHNGSSSRVVGPSSISVNRQCITVIKFANEWRVNGLLYV